MELFSTLKKFELPKRLSRWLLGIALVIVTGSATAFILKVPEYWHEYRDPAPRITLNGGADLLLVSYVPPAEPNEAFALNPFNSFVPMVGRENERAALNTFLSSPAPVSLRVLIGSAGSDKERLAFTFSRDAKEQGWKTAYLKERDLNAINKESFVCNYLEWRYPTLLVVENAMPSSDALRKLLTGLLDNRSSSKTKIRILLLAREADTESGWWNNLFGRYRSGAESVGISQILDPIQPVELLPLPLDARLETLRTTLKRAGSSLSIPDTPEFRKNLSNAPWAGEPVFLIMAH